jgi:hypothetical protein
LPRPQKIFRPAHTPLKSDFYNKIGPKQTWFQSCLPRTALRRLQQFQQLGNIHRHLRFVPSASWFGVKDHD